MIEQLISRVFYSRNLAHFEHWRAKGVGSYARHTALGSFYEDIIDALDALVEAHQGANDLIGRVPATKDPQADVLAALEEDAAWIEKNHEGVCGGHRAVGNLLDNIAAVYLSAIYKLKNLK